MKLGRNGCISEDMQEIKRQGRVHCKLVIECGGDGLMVNAGMEAREGYHSLRCGPWKRTRVTCFLAGAGGCRRMNPLGSGENRDALGTYWVVLNSWKETLFCPPRRLQLFLLGSDPSDTCTC